MKLFDMWTCLGVKLSSTHLLLCSPFAAFHCYMLCAPDLLSFRIRSLEAERRTLLGRADSLAAECAMRKNRESGKSNFVVVSQFRSRSSPETNFLVVRQKLRNGGPHSGRDFALFWYALPPKNGSPERNTALFFLAGEVSNRRLS